MAASISPIVQWRLRPALGVSGTARSLQAKIKQQRTRACSHAGIVSGDNEKVPIHCRYFFTVRLGLGVSNYRHPLTPCAARKKLNLFASQRD